MLKILDRPTYMSMTVQFWSGYSQRPTQVGRWRLRNGPGLLPKAEVSAPTSAWRVVGLFSSARKPIA